MAFNLSQLDGENGFRILGVDPEGWLGLFNSVAGAGDINGDGIADLVLGAPGSFHREDLPSSGYVIFGSTFGFDSELNLSTLDGSNGFKLPGIAIGDGAGFSVSGLGDFNGDGIDDFAVGAWRFDTGDSHNSGEGYVVFGGGDEFSSSRDLTRLDGLSGFRVAGVDAYDISGSSVAGADINGDGLSDLGSGPINRIPTRPEI